MAEKVLTKHEAIAAMKVSKGIELNWNDAVMETIASMCCNCLVRNTCRDCGFVVICDRFWPKYRALEHLNSLMRAYWKIRKQRRNDGKTTT